MDYSQPPSLPRQVRFKEHLAISTFWAASNFVWGALIIIVIQSQVKHMAPLQKGLISGLTVSVGAIAALIIPLLIGPLSDRSLHPMGRRRPYMFWGVLINLFGLGILYLAGNVASIPWYMFAYFIMTIGNNIATAAYSGVIPDLIPEDQRGTASGYMAVMSQVGTLIGIYLCGIYASKQQFGVCYAILAGALILGLIVSMRGIKETPIKTSEPLPQLPEFLSSLIEPLRHRDFMWVWLTRALVMFGFYCFVPLVQYYFSDVIGVENPETATSELIGIVIFCAALSGYVGGWLSDRVGRKKIVYFANSFMAIMCLAFIFCTTLSQVLIVGVLFGIGYGAYVSVDWALGTDVLPSKEDAAKDMAVWHISMTLPQAIAAAPAGYLVGAFGRTYHIVNGESVPRYTHMGFAALFIVAAIFLGLGALLLRNVKGAR